MVYIFYYQSLYKELREKGGIPTPYMYGDRLTTEIREVFKVVNDIEPAYLKN